MRRISVIIINSLLLIGVAGLLIVYLIVVSALPTQVYTQPQMEFLAYNSGRMISQVAPMANIVLADGELSPTILPVQESRVWANLIARYEEQEGVSATVYDLDFRGEYRLVYSGPATTTVFLHFPFPNNLETLHDVRFLVDGEEPIDAQFSTDGITWQATLEAGEERQVEIGYKADGAGSFTYGLHRNLRSDVDVTVTVLGLRGSEASQASLPATIAEAIDGGETFTWNYAGLIADRDIELTLPVRLSFAQRVARLQDDFETLAGLAPFLVALFLASLAGLLHLGGVRLRLTSYLLTGCGLALFYPLLTFLSGLVDVFPAAVIALVAVSALLVIFLGLAAGWRKTWWRAGLLLLVFLGIFSLGMLTPWRGLLLTGGGLLLVGVFMISYARRSMPEELAPIVAALQEDAPPAASLAGEEPEEIELSPPPLAESAPELTSRHCPHCGRTLADDHVFCPSCGYDLHPFRRCGECGHEQFVLADLGHCVRCGEKLE